MKPLIAVVVTLLLATSLAGQQPSPASPPPPNQVALAEAANMRGPGGSWKRSRPSNG